MGIAMLAEAARLRYVSVLQQYKASALLKQLHAHTTLCMQLL